MSKTFVVAFLVVVLVAGVVAYASALDSTVAVTAKVNPAFEMTISEPAVDFGGTLNLGALASESTTITVKSNRFWEFTKAQTAASPELSGILVESTNIAPGVNKPKGINEVVATYDLDLTTNAAYQLSPDATYTASYQYTAVPTIP